MQCQATPDGLEKWKADFKSASLHRENSAKQVQLVYVDYKHFILLEELPFSAIPFPWEKVLYLQLWLLNPKFHERKQM